MILDIFNFLGKSVNRFLDDILANQQLQDTHDHQAQTTDGRFPCSFPGCNHSFKYDGASKRKHELTHGTPTETLDSSSMRHAAPEDSITTLTTCGASGKETPCDDMYNYNCALLADGLLFLNFLDAVSEGDGARLMRQYKYMLIHCKADGQHSAKYALECLYQSFYVNSLLSPRDCERFVWNRTVNSRGGRGNNIAHDLEVEHSNRFIKGAIKNLGPNVTEKSVQRIAHSENGVRVMLDKVDHAICRIRYSGRHTPSSKESDLDELVKRSVHMSVYTEQSNRRYQHFKNFERDPFKNVNMSSLYTWINQHKKNILCGKRAR